MKNAILLTLLGVASLARAESKPLQVVPRVELARYLGKWYEIATIPQRFQKGCTGVTATYTLRPDGNVKVLNECRKDSLNGKYKSITGKAWVTDRATNAKLKVQFFWPFSGDYWILGLDPEYRWALVGGPGHKYLWILSRDSRMDDTLYARIVELARSRGYDVGRLMRTPQQ